MTPKEKALQLANKFVEKSVFDMTNEELKDERIKAVNRALIAVEEILNELSFDSSIFESYRDYNYIDNRYEYYEQVKEELIKLKQ